MFTRENPLLVWGGNVEHPEAYGLSEQLQVTRFPFLVLLACPGRASNSVKRVMHMEGEPAGPAPVLAALRQAIQRGQAVVDQQNQVRLESLQRDQMRNEQDREYEEALEADRRRAEEAKAKEAAEREAAEAQELEAAVELSRQLSHESDVQRKKDRLVEEPPAGPDSTNLRINLPAGGRLQRRFPRTAPVQAVRDFIDVTFSDQGVDIVNYNLTSNFPRCTFEAGDDSKKSLEEAGLHPQAVLFVQNLDS